MQVSDIVMFQLNLTQEQVQEILHAQFEKKSTFAMYQDWRDWVGYPYNQTWLELSEDVRLYLYHLAVERQKSFYNY